MKAYKTKSLFLLVVIAMVFSCTSQKRYLLKDNNDDKYFLVDILKEEKRNGKLSHKPIVVVDGVPFRYDYELKNQPLNLYKTDIDRIEVINRKAGISLYGNYAKDGVAVITTNSVKEKSKKSLGRISGDYKILFILNDKIVGENVIETLDPNTIDSMDVIKNKEAISKYTSEDYDGVIIIRQKK